MLPFVRGRIAFRESACLAVCVVAWIVSACAGGGRGHEGRTASETPARAPSLSARDADSSEVVASVIASPTPARYVTLVTDRTVLKELEASGASLGELLDGRRDARSNEALARAPRFASILSLMEGDVRAARAADPASGVGMAYAHRLFDTRVLRAKDARFDLVGVAFRLDRAHARPNACGEARLVYRLAYATEHRGLAVASRLPMTLALVFDLAPELGMPCHEVAQRARIPETLVTASWLTRAEGPLGKLEALRRRFRSVELNAQIVRWPSTVRPDLGGHAEYLMRVLVPSDGSGLVASTLENTPDVARLLRDREARGALTEWVRENLDAIDAGTALLPEQWLATKASSVSPRGLARYTNRPFRRLLAPSALADLAPTLAGRAEIGSVEALVRRLDQLSCPGCHQSRSVAGFHLLGEDDEAGANALALPASPHLVSEVARRQALIARVVASPRDDVVRELRNPSAERAPHDRGVYGARCGLGDPGFAAWTCTEGLLCRRTDRTKGEDMLVGTCLPEAPSVGGPCEHGVVTTTGDSARDRATIEHEPCASDAVCDRNRVGFPGGMCKTSCQAAGQQGTCAGIPVLTTFNACLARTIPFEKCIEESTTPAGVRACDEARPCREDYVCARAPRHAGGACMPPYFLFQLRVDGHPPL